MVTEIINQKVAAYFDERGESYSDAWASVAKQRLSRFETSLVRRAIESALQNSGGERIKTLDIGIGTGRVSEAVLDYEVEHYGVDISQTMIDYCREKFKGNKKVKQLVVHDIVKPLPTVWGKFDVVSALRVLSYAPLRRNTLRNIYGALKPGGTLVFSFPNKHSSTFLPKLLFRKSYYGHETTRGDLEKTITDAGFSEIKIGGFCRLLDIFYDWCDNNFSADVLFAVENFLRALLGPTLLARLFYITCKK